MWWLKRPPQQSHRQYSMSNKLNKNKIVKRQIIACCLSFLIATDVIASITPTKYKSGNHLPEVINTNDFGLDSNSKGDGLSEKEKVVATYQLNNHQLVNYAHYRSDGDDDGDLVNDDTDTVDDDNDDKLINVDSVEDSELSHKSSGSGSSQKTTDNDDRSVDRNVDKQRSDSQSHSRSHSRTRSAITSAQRGKIELNSNDNLFHYSTFTSWVGTGTQSNPRAQVNTVESSRQLNKQVQSKSNSNSSNSTTIVTDADDDQPSHSHQRQRERRHLKRNITSLTSGSKNIATTQIQIQNKRNINNHQIPKKYYDSSLHSSSSSSSNSLFNHSEKFISHKDAINNQSNVPIDLFSELNEIHFDNETSLESRRRRKKEGYYEKLPNGVIVYRRYDCYLLTAPPRSRLTTARPTQAGWKLWKGCNCHIHGSQDRICDRRTGQCKCRPYVTGRRCDQCEFGFWNVDSKNGCVPCTCNSIGSLDRNCDTYTGQCFCKPGVAGLNCDHCAPGHFDFSESGCRPCEVCDSNSYICDPDTGRCVCPPLSNGYECRQCVSNSWGWEFQKGCKNCQCDRFGAIGQACHNITGQCECREGFAGLSCNQCAPGFYNFPTCKKCDCDPRGSITENGEVVIACDEFGQCPCKELVTGRRCNRCKSSTFGLSLFNPLGCFNCFCFGRSRDCQESALSWGQLRVHGSRNLTFEYLTPYQTTREEANRAYNQDIIMIQFNSGASTATDDLTIVSKNGLHLIPSTFGNFTFGAYEAFYEPLYMRLPHNFFGDQTKSYGGHLKFSVSTIGAGELEMLPYETLKKFPLVQIHSHHTLILNYYGPEILDASANATYVIRMHEQYWKYHFDGKNVDRAIFMTALENIKLISIRVTTALKFNHVLISDVTLDTAIYIQGATNDLATSIEVCDCPHQYDGLSCQLPQDGYYRWRSRNDSEVIEDLVGHVLPCSCNGRSEICEKETGQCLNCRENTGGATCELCAEGYYGNPAYGCQACPCPETRKNFSKGCHVRGTNVECICKPGYTGRFCEQCSPGFFGNPEDLDGSCQPCDCNLDGVLSNDCDAQTGQCVCIHGVTGRRCDKCEIPRTFLQAGRCQTCDNCTQTLLDTIDELIFDFDEKTMHLDLKGIPAPWITLNNYDNLTNHWIEKFKYFDDARHIIENFDEKSIEKLETKSRNVQTKSSKQTNKAEKLLNRSQKIDAAANTLLVDLSDISGNVSDIIKALDSYGKQEHHTLLPVALQEATQIRDNIKQAYDQIDRSSTTRNNITAAMECANKYHSMWLDIAGNVGEQSVKLQQFKLNMGEFAGKLDDLRKYALSILDKGDEIHLIQKKSDAELERVADKYKEIETILSDINAIFDGSLNADSDVFLKLFKENLLNIDNDVQTIVALRNDVDDLYVENADLLNDVKTFDIPRAREHATVLENRAKDYEGRYENTKRRAADAMSAIETYENITDSIDAARILAEDALEAAKIANDEIYPEDGVSIIERGKSSLLESETIKKQIMDERDRLSDLKETLNFHQRKVYDMNNTIWQCAVKENKISAALSSFARDDTSNEMREAIEVSEKVSNEMRDVHKNAINTGRDVYKLKNKLSALEPDWEAKVGRAEENITIFLGQIRRANTTIDDIEYKFNESSRNFSKWNDQFLKKIQDLKDQIALAKHAAQGIHISVESQNRPGCTRSYTPLSYGPTTSNHIVLSFALRPKKDRSSPLVFIKGDERRFMALEMVDRKVRFAWNLGDKTKVIEHPQEVAMRDPRFDDAWYRVEVTRVMNFASLSVQRMNASGTYSKPKPVMDASSSEFSRFTMDDNSKIWVGGVPDESDRPERLETSNGLNVVLHQLLIDEQEVGLWKFETTSRSCKGAIQGAQESTSLDNARNFNGQGYAILKPNQRSYKKLSFQVRMTFKTLDENALLFLVVDPKTNGSLSLTIFEGRLIFRVDYLGGSWLELNSTEKVNSGQWITVDVARHFNSPFEEDAKLEVNGESKFGSPNVPIDDSNLPNFIDSDYFIGGLPPGFKLTNLARLRSVYNSFLGCVKDIQIDSESRDPLENANQFGVAPSCKEVITKAGFYGDGFVELPSHSLRKRANFGFVFRTQKPNSLLLLAAYPERLMESEDFKTPLGNYSVNLIDGKINVRIDAGQGAIELTSNLTLNDGEYHIVSVSKIGRRFDLRINDELQSTRSFKAPPFVVNLPEDEGGLYIGGATDEFVGLTSLEPFEGSIKDLVFNNRSVSYDNYIRFSNVHFGRDGPDMGARLDSMMIMKTEPFGGGKRESCNRVGSYSYEPNGFKFGDGANSHSEVKIPIRNMWQRNFSLQFDLRTHYPNGLILVAPGTKEKQKHFVMVTLRDGFINFIVRGRKKQNLDVPLKINDGQWHRVIITNLGRKASLSVSANNSRGPYESAHMRLPKRLNASNKLYVGGLPDGPVLLPNELVAKIEGFKGCLRKLMVNNVTQDLAKLHSHTNVGQCFPRVEKGAYFSGDAFAIYKRHFNIGRVLEVELGFKTSELNGILLSVADRDGFPALSLELKDGNIIFSCDLGDGIPLRAVKTMESKYTLCDNKWHTVYALYDSEQIFVRVDNFTSAQNVAINRNGRLQTKSPLYIGGLPDTASQGTLLARDNFKGCIDNVVVQNDIRDWIDFDNLHNVLLNECPSTT